MKRSPSFSGLVAASALASKRAQSASAKRKTKPEEKVAAALRKLGFPFRRNVDSVLGSPDFVFASQRVAVFVDGDFWHGRNFERRRPRLLNGHNAAYWIAKIESNMARDLRLRRALRRAGWRVIRIWEGDTIKNLDRVLGKLVRKLG